jgi:hypothetical protein
LSGLNPTKAIDPYQRKLIKKATDDISAASKSYNGFLIDEMNGIPPAM